MPTAETHVETERPGRYLVQLCRHADQMRRHLHRPRPHGGGGAPPRVRHVEWSDTHGTVRLDRGQWTMWAGAGVLTIRVEAADEAGLRRIQDLVAGRLQQIGRRDGLTVRWQRTDPPTTGSAGATGTAAATGATGATGERTEPPSRRHGRTVALAAAGVLAIAAHLGLGGAFVAGARWTGWTADAVLAVVLVLVLVKIAAARRILGRRDTTAGPGDASG